MSLRWITNVRSSQHRPSKQASFHSFLQNVVKNDYTGAIDLSYHLNMNHIENDCQYCKFVYENVYFFFDSICQVVQTISIYYGNRVQVRLVTQIFAFHKRYAGMYYDTLWPL